MNNARAAAVPELATLPPGRDAAATRPAGGRILLFAVAALAVVIVAFGLFRFMGEDPATQQTGDTTPSSTLADGALAVPDNGTAGAEFEGAASGTPSSTPSQAEPNPGGQAPIERPEQGGNVVYEVTITSTPSGAQVVFDGQRQGTTPLKVPGLSAGTYPVQLRLDGYQNWTGSLKPQEKTTLSAQLRAQLVSTRVVVRPYGSLFVNGDKKLDGDVAAYEDRLPPGRYTMRATNPALGTWEKQVVIRPGDKDLLILFNFEPEYTLTVVSPPVTNAEIFVDGVSREAHTPSTIKLHPGNHTIEVRKEGYRLEGGPRSLTLEGDLKDPLAFTLVEANRE